MNEKRRLTCGLAGVAFLLITLYYGLIATGPAQYFVAPNAQKIFYFHVPAGMITYVAFLIVFSSSAWYLYKESEYADRLAHSAAELGLLFGAMNLASGTLWMQVEWGGNIFDRFMTDMRLATTLAMWLIYVSYVVYRMNSGIDSNKRNAAIIGVLGAVSIPLSYLSSRFLRSDHPVVFASDEGEVDTSMRIGLYLGLCGLLLIFIYLLDERMMILKKEDEINRKKMEKQW
tara:strand:- start:14878 stop:15567 length:690 start_codon:yes stop_codon:yes gene_type:complete